MKTDKGYHGQVDMQIPSIKVSNLLSIGRSSVGQPSSDCYDYLAEVLEEPRVSARMRKVEPGPVHLLGQKRVGIPSGAK